jgi:2-C-methyl-D-erythritol 2,4-cyclodiphosphate synthase
MEWTFLMPPLYRIAQGYDIHRLVSHEPLWIGGVRIESPVGSLAHSDGDVVLHSLIDALLGACGLGDIGDHFPPSDARHANRPSHEFLEEILPLLNGVGEAKTVYTLCNIDVTVFLEKPSLKPYKGAIRERLASLLHLPLDCVSLKAKTAEKFSPVGTQEAIAASVTVLLQAQE